MPAKALNEMCTREKACRLAGISERQLRSWEKLNLIPHLEEFGFSDLVALRTLARLRRSDVPNARIRRAVTSLRERFRLGDYPLRELRLMAEAGKITVQMAGRRMEPLSGQLLLDFEEGPAGPQALAIPQPDADQRDARAATARLRQAEEWVQRALDLDLRAAPLREVVQAYEKALALNPLEKIALVNVGTLYFQARAFEEAERYYRKALEADPSYPLALFNLGNLYDELGRREQAIEFYRRALESSPNYADAHYNLALVYQTTGQTMRAVHHWKTYLRLDPGSSWAAVARRQLDAIYQTAVHAGAKRNR